MSADIRLGRWQDVLGGMQPGSVRLVLTSPPYDNAREYEGTNPTVDFGELADFVIRVLAPGGTLAMVLDGAVNDGALSTTPYEVICAWARRSEWALVQVLAYARDGQPGEYRGRFRRDHEPLIVFRRVGESYICNKEAIADRARNKQSATNYQWATARDGGKRKVTTDRPVRDIRHRGSIWQYGPIGHGHDPSADTGHPATFAEAFALDAIRVWSNPGDLVCDPFLGSGTVARACIDLGRRFVGAEAVAKYHAIATTRCAQTALPVEMAT